MRAWPLALFLLAAPGVASAQETGKPAPRVEYEKKTVINFEDDTIEGDLTKPDGEYVEARKRVSHSNLIRIREEFKNKVMESVGDL